MTQTPEAHSRRVRRLLRCYPPQWRARYGDEFTELLLAELTERPWSWRLTADVARGGAAARLASAGLAGRALEPSEQVRAGLVTLARSLAAFLAFGIAMWAQLTIGWEWAPPGSAGIRIAMVVMSASVLGLGILAVLAAAPVIWTAGLAIAAGAGKRLRGLATLAAAGAVALAAGSHHFENAWPGTGGHAWPHQGLVPGGAAAFSWAATLSVSSYWAHPAMLGRFPAAEIAWMALSPAAVICLMAGVTRAVRGLSLSQRVLRYEIRLGSAAAAGMTFFLIGTSCWVLAGGAQPGTFHAGAIDVAGLAVMLLALAAAWRALGRARRSGLGCHAL